MSEIICAKFEQATQLLGKRWIGLIINQLMQGPKRFSELENEIRLSGKVLSQRLKELEELRMVKRMVYPETPVRIEYALTPKGQSLDSVMEAIADWSHTWIQS